MTRCCLVCANINPCSRHSEQAQDAELGRNIREIFAIEAQRAASADTLPKGQDAQQGLAGTESGAVAKPDAQKEQP